MFYWWLFYEKISKNHYINKKYKMIYNTCIKRLFNAGHEACRGFSSCKRRSSLALSNLNWESLVSFLSLKIIITINKNHTNVITLIYIEVIGQDICQPSFNFGESKGLINLIYTKNMYIAKSNCYYIIFFVKITWSFIVVKKLMSGRA